MAKLWVLDTETKGTGAEVVPYEKTLRKQGPRPELELVRLGGPPKQEPDPEPPQPRRFKVVNVMSTEVLAEDVEIRDAIRALGALGSVVDARVFAWSPERERWQLLSLDDVKTLWSFRDRLGGLPETSAP
jgi:hypothetical protein